MSKQKINSGQMSTLLYDNPTGESTTVTLNETSANYAYLEIFFKDASSNYASIKVYSPNGKTVSMNTANIESGSIQFYSKIAAISTNTITSVIAYTQIFTSGASAGYNNSNTYILITRVIGYKG